MADTGVGRAQGKLILCGEHAVVYGFPAIAIGVDRGTTVCLRRVAGPVRIHSPFGVDARLTQAVHETVGTRGVAVDIVSDLPLGRGMGSSAALAVALVRAHAELDGHPLTDSETHARALKVETVFHGTPSGIDNAVAASGGVLRFQRTADGPVWEHLPTVGLSVVVIDSGSAGDTRELVQGVRSRYPANTPTLHAIADITEQVAGALSDPERLGPLLTRNHGLLRQLGVSTSRLDALVDVALAAGAWGAKLAGAGGGGVVIAVGPEPETIAHTAAAQGYEAFVTRVTGADA